MLVLTLCLGALSLSVAALVSACLLRHPPPGLLQANFRGRQVPQVGGLVLLAGLLAGEFALAVGVLVRPAGRARITFVSGDHLGLLVVALGFFGLGLLDDVAGSSRARGLGGHFRMLARGEITTGAIKALGGAAIALVAGAIWERHLGQALVDAALVALAANLVNLLDLRPGRAVKAFLGGWGVLAAAAWGTAYVPLSLPLAVSAAWWLGPDVRANGMLGDTGANLLGAVAGAGAALSLGLTGRLIVLAALVALTLLSERWSFTRTIAAFPPLRWLDDLGQL